MALNRALVDRARRVYTREDPNGQWQDGQPPAEEAYGPWIKVRFRRQNESEQSSGVTVGEDGALLIGMVDVSGAPVMVNGRFIGWDADDVVEVSAAEGEVSRWHVSSGVRPMRRRKGILGWRCSIRRVRDATVAEEPLSDTDEPVVGLSTSGIVVGGAPAPEDDPTWAQDFG